MTCIVGFIDKINKNMYMGGDSAGVDDRYNLRSRKDVKVFQKEDMLIGYTSSFRMGQLLRFKLKIPKIKKNQDVYEYMCTDFSDSVRKVLIDNGYAKIESNNESFGDFLVAYKGRLFKIEEDLQIAENNYPYNSCGCGENYALGAILALDFYTRTPPTVEKIVNISLQIAEECSAGVRSPFNILKLNY
jgi:ATP-dependent protease HslVU (ClpYQ) peptidase subunit